VNRFIIVDLETTGNNPENDSIIQVGAVVLEDFKIKEVFSSFVYSTQEIPEYIQELTGITPNMLKDAPPINEVINKLLPLMEDTVFVAHHVPFDLQFLNKQLEINGYMPFTGIVLDTLDLARILLPMAQSYKLDAVTQELEIRHDNPHRADDDAMATAKLLLHLYELLQEMPLIYLQRLQDLMLKESRDISLFIEEIIVTKQLRAEDNNYFIMNQLALQPIEIEDGVESSSDKKEQYPFESIFNKNGLLKDKFSNFEFREAQQDMAYEVMSSFEQNKHLMVEAGTGTGKSLAYLIPSIYWANKQNEQVVIATHTINLQEQLFQRDIPLLKEILPFEFDATILKGRNNYLCLRKFEQLFHEYQQVENKEQLLNIAQMLTWVTVTNTGDIEEINLNSSGYEIWNQVKSDPDTCLNRNCPWFKACFYHRARQKAQNSDIIITNHSLLLTDLKADHRILPAYQRLIVDEAHQFHEVAIKHLGMELNQYQLFSMLQFFYKDAKNGFLVKVMNELFQTQDPDKFTIANKIQNHIIPIISKVDANVQHYFTLLGEFVAKKVRQQEPERKVLRIVDDTKQLDEWKAIQHQAENVFIEMTEWANLMEETHRKMKELELEESMVLEYGGQTKEIKDMLYTFSELNNCSDPNMVYWVESEHRGKRYVSYLFASPIEIGPYIKEFLFDKKDTIVLTSATLSVNENFNFIRHEFGFSKDNTELNTLQLDSPFDYKKQSLVFIPKDIPNIQDVSEDVYIDDLSKKIAEMAITLNGKMLVLFTSYRMLTKTHSLLNKILLPFNIKVLGHGVDSNSRSKLTKRFMNNQASILLGTNSFWEGVDIPGEALSALVIVRLPFTPPNNPINEAKTERLKKQGKNPFMEMSVPQAVIRFKQGFGRLIRTQRDKGIVVIFDRRVVESRYGKAFIRSLPPVNVKYQPFEYIIKLLDGWLKE